VLDVSEHCLFCGGHLDAQGACDLCGTRRLAVAEKRIGARCPRCAAERLAPVGIGEVVVQGCTRCRGLFVSSDEWDAILDPAERQPLPREVLLGPVGSRAATIVAEEAAAHPYRQGRSAPPEDVPPLPAKVDVNPPVACPVCNRPCDRVEFAGLSRVVVDVCERHGIWLDAGELAQAVARVRENPVFLEGHVSPAEREARARDVRRDPSLLSLLIRAVMGPVR
jgi:Zn-finger nucleic acid-binding protein